MSGLENRYQVQKRSNPDKRIDCIVLEFDDPIARVGIKAWSIAMLAAGYTQVFKDVQQKLYDYENPQPIEEESEPEDCYMCDGTGKSFDDSWFCTHCMGSGRRSER